MRFLDVKTDFAFKRVFGAEESKPILIDFLNAILGYEGEYAVAELEILDPYLAPKITGMKDTFVDVRARLANGKNVIIEMQVLNVEGFEKRILYNAAKEYSGQLAKGEAYKGLNPVIALTFTNFSMFDFDKYHSVFRLLETTTLTEYSGELELVFVELPKFNVALDDLKTVQEKWIYFVQNAGDMSCIPENFRQPDTLPKAFERANEAALSPEELDLQIRRHIFIQDQRGALSKAKSEGWREGMAAGMQQGSMRTLQRQLARRFGLVPPEITARIAAASPEDVEIWLDRILDAPTLDDVFVP